MKSNNLLWGLWYVILTYVIFLCSYGTRFREHARCSQRTEPGFVSPSRARSQSSALYGGETWWIWTTARAVARTLLRRRLCRQVKHANFTLVRKIFTFMNNLTKSAARLHWTEEPIKKTDPTGAFSRFCNSEQCYVVIAILGVFSFPVLSVALTVEVFRSDTFRIISLRTAEAAKSVGFFK